MKYKIDDRVIINNTEWRIAEHRMGRGRQYMYTLSHEETDGKKNKNIPSVNGMLREGAVVKVTAISLSPSENSNIRVVDDLGKIWFVKEEDIKDV